MENRPHWSLAESDGLEEMVRKIKEKATQRLQANASLPSPGDHQTWQQVIDLCNHWLYAPEKPDWNEDHLRELWKKVSGPAG